MNEPTKFQPAGEMQLTRCIAVHQYPKPVMTEDGTERLEVSMRVELELQALQEIELGGYFGVVPLVPQVGPELVVPDTDTIRNLNGKRRD